MKKKEFWKLEPGTQVGLKERHLKFWNEKAFEMCAIGGKLEEKHANDFFARKALGQGMPYFAKILELREDVEGSQGKKVPGALVEVIVGEFVDRTLISHKDLKHVRK